MYAGGGEEMLSLLKHHWALDSWSAVTYADVCGRMLTYADVFAQTPLGTRLLERGHVCGRMRTYSDVC